MKRILFALMVLSLSSVSCSESGEGKNCDSNMVSFCNSAGTALVVCEDGVLNEQQCEKGCSQSTNECIKKDNSTTFGCTEISYPRQCSSDLSSYSWCENGVIKTQACALGQRCNVLSSACEYPQQQTECTEQTNPAVCLNNVLTFCMDGTVYTVTCGTGTTCDAVSKTCRLDAVQPSESSDICDSESFEKECVTPRQLKTCENGKVKTVTCSPSQICNQSLKEKSCKVANVGENCDPEAFSEICYGQTEAIYCDSETHKVVRADCVDMYGEGYKCDIAENYDGQDRDVTICYSNAENCSEAGEIKTECTFEDIDGYRQFYTITYLCAEFNVGLHYYMASEETCEHKCNAQKTACSD